MKRLLSLAAIASLAFGTLLLSGCASTLRSDVTSFQRWPANAAGSTFGFKKLVGQEGSLEHASYEDIARAELTRLGLKDAPAGSKPRFEVSLDYGVVTRAVKSREPIFNDRQYWHPATLHPTLGWQPGFWARDPYGPTVVGYRSVTRDVSTRRLRVDISEGGSKVFEASASSNGANATLTVTMPYLIRSVFDGFPGANGQARSVEFDTETGAVKGKKLAVPG
jgi:Domain of unknown function (DUF4136)